VSGRGLRWWAWAGVFAGLALMSKYSAVLTIGGAFAYLLADRRWLLRPGPYVAVVLAALVFSPVVAWNATHHWTSFAFQGDRALGLQLHPVGPLTVLGGEALFVLPWIWLPMMALLVRRVDRLTACLAWPPIAGFALISLWSSQRILYHWAAPGYLVLFPELGRAVADRIGTHWVRRTIGGTAALLVTVLLVIVLQLRFDVLGDRLAAVMRKDPTAEGLDWSSVRDDLRLPPGTIVGTFNWRDAGKLGYALGPEATMLCLSGDARQFGFAHPPADYAGKDVVLLAVDPAPHALDDARRWFAAVDVLPSASIRLDGRVLGTVTVIRGHELAPPSSIP
jgi:hypothetical protein